LHALDIPIVTMLSDFVFNLCDSVEYNVSYVYHSMFAYFDRDNVALKGFAKYVKHKLQYALWSYPLILFLISQTGFQFHFAVIVEIRFFKESSEEEREHAEKLMKYQVKLALYLIVICLDRLI